MKRTTLFILINLFLLACEHAEQINLAKLPEPYELRLSKIVQGSQFSIYRYDDDRNIIKYEFAHGLPGSETLTIYADYFYQINKLSVVEQYVLLNGQYEKPGIEEYEYDTQNRIKRIKYQHRSEIDFSWRSSTQEFFYNEHDQVIKTTGSDGSYVLYYYDASGNIWKWEGYLFGREYDGPLTITYTYDSHKNPFYLHDIRQGILRYFSPNNIIGWESISPETGEVVARSSSEFEYNSTDYPISATETVVSPLTDPQPNTEIFHTAYEYLQ